MTAAPRFRSTWLWLLALLPGDLVVVMDLVHGAFRPGVWLARMAPALLVLWLVAWSSLNDSALAVRLRKELRLLLFPGLLLLLSSGGGLVVDVVPPFGLFSGVMHAVWTLALVLPAAALLNPMVREYERDTLAALLVTPRGTRAFAEKFALGALVVVLSWLQLSTSQPRFSELWNYGLAGHALAVVSVPTWFLLGKKEGSTLGLVILVPFLAAAPVALLGTARLVMVELIVYGGVVLALFPWALRRGLLAPGLDEHMAVPGGSWARRLPPLNGAELVAQREAFILGGVGALASLVICALEGTEEAKMVLFMVGVLVAALSPSLAFAEAQSQGTLEPLLVMRPRREVFRLKALSSLAVMMLACVLVPLLLLLATGTRGEVGDALAWCCAMGFVWSLGLAVSVHVSGAAGASSVALGLAFIGTLLLVAGFVTASLGLSAVLDTGGSDGSFLGAAFVVSTAIAVFVAWRRFVHLPAAPHRQALLGAGVGLLHALVLGIAAAVSGVLGPAV